MYQTQLNMTNYPTNVSNSQWQIISKFLDLKRSRKFDLREVVNGILYLVKTGCQWRMLPQDFPRWEIVYYYFNKWKKNDLIEQLHEWLVEKNAERRRKEQTAKCWNY